MGSLSHTVSGNIASFRTPSRVPIESLKFHFLPKQAAGTPSLENPIPIEGWTGLNGKRAGKNLIEPHYGIETEQRGLTITPSTNGIRVSGTASARTAVYLSKTEKKTKLGVGDKVTFSLYLSGDISECENPFLGYYKSSGVWGGVIGSLSSSNDYKATWTVPNGYTDESLLDSYIYIPQGVTVNFEIGLQMEEGSTATTYEPYFISTIPLSWSDHGVEYGGYIDPVRGKLVAEYEMLTDTWGNWGTAQDMGDGTTLRYKKFTNPVYGNSINNHHTDYCNVAKYGYANENGNPHYYIVGNSYNCRVYLPNDFSTDQVIQVIGKLITPIEYDIDPISIKAFLDHNNFWSDANDITEVTYAITESKDMLATRKKAMDFDIGHRRKVNWNQWAPEVNTDNWQAYDSNKLSLSFNNGIVTQTWLSVGSGYVYSICTKRSKRHVINRYYYLSYEYCTDFVGRLYGTVGGTNGNSVDTIANTWQRYSCLIKRIDGGNMDNCIAYVGRFANNTGIEIGSTCQMRNPIVIDITQMFGEGNEPTTRAEFEHICEINGIDLTTYQSYDTGSDRWLIVP